jgi:YHS domain-containing protein
MKRPDQPTHAVDPVCGMTVDPASAPSGEHRGRTYYFCSETCRQRFQREPERYGGETRVAGGAPPRPPSPEGRAAEPAAAGRVRRQETDGGGRWRSYLPVLIVVATAAAAAVAGQVGYEGPWSGKAWMHDFMGLFLVIFAMFKFFDLPGFADGFRRYDLLAKRVRGYAYVYPFIELGLGLGYLTQRQDASLYVLTIAVMTFGAFGVIRALRQGLDLDCACLGTVLKVPLSTVALIEDLGMAAMAAAMWAGDWR